MRKLFRSFKTRLISRRHELGLTLVEILVALAILGIVAPVFLMGAATALKAVMISQERVAAESLAKSQMESIKSEDYKADGSYTEITIPPDLSAQGYDIDISFTPSGAGPQKVTVTVNKDGKQLLQVTDYKVER